jgi:RNA polymerase sigma-70 factor (ECF subfamily)
MSGISPDDITQLLQAWSEGDDGALEKLTPLVYRELYRLAGCYMGREREGHTLQATALVNEAYLRLIDWTNAQWQNRAHFFAVSAQLMRRILVDYARSRHYAKRGGGARPAALDNAEPQTDDRLSILVEIDLALQRLALIDPRLAQVVELRFFGGLSIEETAEVLKVAAITVIRDWNFAKVWLLRELGGKAKSETGALESNSNDL